MALEATELIHQGEYGPLSQSEVGALVRQARKDAQDADLPFYPDEGLRKKIGHLALWMRESTSASLTHVASKLGVSTRIVLDGIARARNDQMSRADVGVIRERIAVQLEELAAQAMESGDMTEARRCLLDYARLYGLASTGGNAYSIAFGDQGGGAREQAEVQAAAWAAQHGVTGGET